MEIKLTKEQWVEKYGKDTIHALRKFNDYADGPGKDKVKKLKTDLTKLIFREAIVSDDERKQVRDMADAVVYGGKKLQEHELIWIIFRMGVLTLQAETEVEEKDIERFHQLCVIYDDLKKRPTKLKLKCSSCGRSLKGATIDMIGDTK